MVSLYEDQEKQEHRENSVSTAVDGSFANVLVPFGFARTGHEVRLPESSAVLDFHRLLLVSTKFRKNEEGNS